MTLREPYDPSWLPKGVRSSHVDNSNGLDVHVLDAGDPNDPAILLLHGFPELAYSWRKVLRPLADAGFHVIAPDQRGYGRTLGWGPVRYEDELWPYRVLNLVRDALGVLDALGHETAAAVVGHDYGASVAGWSSLVRPDVFESCVLMSAPFGGAPDRALGPVSGSSPSEPDIHEALAKLDRPRKHYQSYFAGPSANAELVGCLQGVHDFLRAYYHHKSADWAGNRPHRLDAWSAEQLALMPTYYILDLAESMPEAVAKEMPTAAEIEANEWLRDDELAVYAAEYERNGFQGGLNWYRRSVEQFDAGDLEIFSGRTIDQPSFFVSGSSDWGTYQRSGLLEKMNGSVCTDMRGVHLIDGAGHWVQQEKPAETVALLLDFLSPARG